MIDTFETSKRLFIGCATWISIDATEIVILPEITYEYTRLNLVIYRLYTNILVTEEWVGAINLKCIYHFLLKFNFYTCAGHVLHTHASACKCMPHAFSHSSARVFVRVWRAWRTYAWSTGACMWVVHHLLRNSTEIGPFVLLEMALSIHEIELQFPKPYQTVKSEKCETFSVSKLAIGVKKKMGYWLPTSMATR